MLLQVVGWNAVESLDGRGYASHEVLSHVSIVV